MQHSLLKLLSCLCVLLSVLIVHAQPNTPWSCADEQIRSFQNRRIRGYEKLRQQLDLQVREYITAVQRNAKKPFFNGRTTSDSTFVIPVVVHVIYPAGEAYGTGTNISYAQIRSQIEALNAAFSRDYSSYNGQTHPFYAQNTHIRFCLARTAWDGKSWAQGPGGTEYGVRRYSATSAYNHFINEASANQLLSLTHPLDNFPFANFMNIWLVKSVEGSNSIMGYAPRPIMQSYPLDGIVMRADIFGDNTTGGNYLLGFGLMQGKILVHEVGHYLGLYHIFQGGCTGQNAAGSATDACDLNGDMICDIEPATTQNILCTTDVPNTCSANYSAGTTSLDMINDYMSYADDDCMNTFTLNQSQRMWAILNLEREGLWQTSNLIATGIMGPFACIPPYLNSQIITGNSGFCVNAPIGFSNPTAGNTATRYQWQFPGGVPSTSASNSVTVVYAVPGNYKAILSVSDGTIVKTDSITFSVFDCKLDSSLLHMSHWYFGNFCSLDFSSGTPVQTTTALVNNTMQAESAWAGQQASVQGTVSLSDSSGNLLFYSNGVSVWNKNHQKINSSSIFGVSDINYTTGISYVPFPAHSGKYFIVGTYPNVFTSAAGVRFVLVDLNSDIVTSYEEFRHQSLPNKFSEFLTVVPHCNGTDYWIIVKGYGFEDTKFYSFLVNKNGIDVNQLPVISSGFSHPGYGGSGNQLKANRQATKLILASPHGYEGIEAGAVYDFDNLTGQVKNERKIPNVPGYSNIQSGTAFSHNGAYFYIMRSSNAATNGLPYWLFQYREKDLQYNIIPTTGFYFAYPFQLGPDHQLYILNGFNYLARLSDPDNWGGASFDGGFIYLKAPGQKIFAGASLPAFIDAKYPDPQNPDFSSSVVSCNTYRFSTPCYNDYLANWDFGDGSPPQTGTTVTHTFVTEGEFNVLLTLRKNASVYGSVIKKIKIVTHSASITGPENVCASGNYPSQYYATVIPGAKYEWTAIGGNISGPNTLPFVNVIWSSAQTNGKIQLKIIRDSCSLDTNKNIAITRGSVFEWTLKDSVCITDSSFKLVANPVGGNFSGRGVKDGMFSPSLAGLGYHQITYTYFDEISCSGQDQKIIKVKNCKTTEEPPVDTLVGADTTCEAMLANIQIAPNPVIDILKIKSTHVLKFVQVYNAIGQKVAEGQLINNRLKLPFLAPGVFTVLVYCDKKIFFKPLVFLKTY